jgi:hypothetical protein
MMPAMRWRSLHEPYTVVTDVMLAIAAAGAAIGLAGADDSGAGVSQRIGAATFAAVAVSAALGAAAHGIGPDRAARRARRLWQASLASGAVGGWLLLAAVTLALSAPAVRAPILAVAAGKSAALGLRALAAGSFRALALDGALNLFAAGGIAVPAAVNGTAGAGPLLAGLSVALLATAVQRSRLRAGPLNHNDLFHVALLPAVWLVFHGLRVLGAP